MGLNKGQQAAFIDVIKFVNDPEERFMCVSGGAGTGKTYFISQVADGILRHKEESVPLHTVSITATTNKAAAVIAEAMPHRAGTIGTVYSFMNLRVSENFSTGKVSVVPTPRWTVHHGIFLIIDECSMVNSELFKYLEKGLDSSCKVLFVGDKNQLAPVKETLSQVYKNNYRTSYLTKPVRNAEQPALMELCEQAKQTVLTGKFTPIIEVPGVIDFVDGTQMKGILEREYTQEDPTRRVLSYTNQRVVEYNTFIRQLRGYTEPFEVGEILTNNSSAELVGKERLYTDQMVRVEQIVSDEMRGDIVQGESLRIITLLVEDVSNGTQYNVSTFADPEDRQNVLKWYAGLKKWDRYFKVKGNYPDLRSVAASTTHKAQGSTYNSVVVDLADIGKCTQNDQTARMLYVALSRPKQRLYLRGKLPDRYYEE